MKLIYEKSVPGRRGVCPPRRMAPAMGLIHERLLRDEPAGLPEVPEVEVVRHFTNLSRQNFSIDTHFYPLGSCTMKYNPKACEAVAALPGFAHLHPLWPQLRHGGQLMQGALRLLYETERVLSELTGMAEFTLQPLAGAHGELTGVMLMAAFHRDRGRRKTHVLIPDSAHGTNPASARLGGFDVVTIPSNSRGTVDVERLKAAVNEQTAGMMLTNPNTLGLFEPDVRKIADIVHAVDGLMYYDGANFNAILGRCKPADQGFDICHLNLHKTFASPHGGGGPGAGPVGVVDRLRPYLPISRVVKTKDGTFSLDYDQPKSIGYIAPFYGNFGVLLRAYAYCLLLGREGLRDVSNRAVLNANYVLNKLRPYYAASEECCMHECVISVAVQKYGDVGGTGSVLGRKDKGKPARLPVEPPCLPAVAALQALQAGGQGGDLACPRPVSARGSARGVRAMDIAKGLIDRGVHPPTVYFPLIVPEAIMIEPTETETRETLDEFIHTMIELARLAGEDPGALKKAPVTTPVGRLDEVAAARDMNLVYSPSPECPAACRRDGWRGDPP